MSHASNWETIKGYLTETYDRSTTTGVPKKADLTFGNSIKTMDFAVVFYVDMRSSRKISQESTEFVSSKVHKSFLQALIYCVENRDGHFRSFNGDGALAFFRGENAASRAVKAAMDLKAYVRKINDVLQSHSTSIDFGAGLAQGKVHVVKSGKRGDDQTKQDLVWIGLPVYIAVELSDLGAKKENIWITHTVRESIDKQQHLNVVTNSDGDSIWVKWTKNLASAGSYDVRSTRYYSTIF